MRLIRYFMTSFTILMLITALPWYVRAQAGNADADLVNIYQGAGSLSPAFSPSVTEYWVRMRSSEPGYFSAAIPSNSEATMEYSMNGSPWTGIPFNTSTGYLPTNRGDNTFQIRVTSTDLTATKTYTIHVYYPPANDANLIDLRSDNATLSPGFQSSVTNYTANVPYTTSSISFTGVLDDPAASFRINGTAVTDGVASGSIPLNVGSNTIEIQVTSQDGTSGNVYSITVKRKNNDASLSGLVVSPGILNETFSSERFNYTLENVGNATDTLTVSPTPADPAGSSIRINVNGGDYAPVTNAHGIDVPLAVGSNLITIEVIAEDSSFSKQVTISVKRLQDSTVYPTSGTFDKYSSNTAEGHDQDVVITLASNGNTLSGIKLDDTTLEATSYTVTGNTVTIHKEYLATLETGYHVLTFVMNGGMNPLFDLLVNDTTPPVLDSAVAGDGHIYLTWNPVDGSTGYKIYQSSTSGTYGPEVATVTGSTYDFDVIGLTNGTAYYFVVKATNPGGDGAASNEVSATPKTVPASSNEITPRPSTNAGDGDGNDSVTHDNEDNHTPANPIATGNVETTMSILVNGKAENWGSATTTRINNQTVTTISLDPAKFKELFAAASQGTVITIPFRPGSDVVIGEFDGQFAQILEQNQAMVKIQTDRATYMLPARQINIESISNQLGQSAALQDMIVRIEIAAPASDMLQTLENASNKGNFKLVAPPLNFTVRAVYHNSSLEVSRFSAYVERTITIPDEVDANQITTGIVVEPDGEVHHVPTKLAVTDGKYYAKIQSLSNSTYAIVSHPVEFEDAADHWAKSAINDLGSRLIISGIGSRMYAPDQDITRAEFATILVRGLGVKLENGGTAFSDVHASDWYGNAIQTAYANRLISGFDDGGFHPTDKVTREQAMAMLSKAMTLTCLQTELLGQETNAALAPYKDAANVSDWAKKSIADCLRAGIVSGRNETELAPKAFITRAEMAVMIQRFLQKSELI